MAGLRKRPERQLKPATVRYLRQRRHGLDERTATLAVALEIGLQKHVMDGEPPPSGLLVSRWTLAEMDALMVLREFHLVGGPKDGADRWPHYIDGPVNPP